jgi:hypothetical protein
LFVDCHTFVSQFTLTSLQKGRHIKCLVKDTDSIGNDAKPLDVAVTPKGDVAILFVGDNFAEVQVYRWNG